MGQQIGVDPDSYFYDIFDDEKEAKQALVKEEKKKQKDKGNKLKKNPNFKGSAKDKFLAKMREPQSLKIRTYEEFMEDERVKKERKESETAAKDEDDDKEKD